MRAAAIIRVWPRWCCSRRRGMCWSGWISGVWLGGVVCELGESTYLGFKTHTHIHMHTASTHTSRSKSVGLGCMLSQACMRACMFPIDWAPSSLHVLWPGPHGHPTTTTHIQHHTTNMVFKPDRQGLLPPRPRGGAAHRVLLRLCGRLRRAAPGRGHLRVDRRPSQQAVRAPALALPHGAQHHAHRT